MNSKHKISVSLWIYDNKDLYDSLFANKDLIEQPLGYELEWNRLDVKKAALACLYLNGLDFENQDNYSQLMNEIVDKVVEFRNVFKSYI